MRIPIENVPIVPASIACVAGSSHRLHLEETQDAAVRLCLSGISGAPAVVVADGIGGFARGGDAARIAVREAHGLLAGNDCPRSLEGVFADVRERLAQEAEKQEQSQTTSDRIAPENQHQSYGTTLLIAAETSQSLIAAYAGNGGVFHIRGDFADWGEHLPLPWSFTNYLNPHTVCEQGREALVRYVGAFAEPWQAEPTVVNLRKDRRVGDLLLICTDGIFSSDQVRCGDPGDGSAWAEVPEPLIALHRTLRSCFATGNLVTEEAIQTAMDAMLSNLRDRQVLDDDATLGLIVTGEALAYQRRKGKDSVDDNTD